MKVKVKQLLTIAILFLSFTYGIHATLHDFETTSDSRNVISIDEGFGFIAGGMLRIEFTDFKLEYGPNDPPAANPTVGILMYRSQRVLRDDVGDAVASSTCLFRTAFAKSDDIYAAYPNLFHDGKTSATLEINITAKNEGFYRAFYANCEQMTAASFKVHLNYTNPGPSYLSAGLMPMPVLYGISSVLFGGALAAWITLLIKRREKVMKIHIFMAITVFVKVCTLISQAVRFEWIKVSGSPNGWNVIFYIFTFFKASFIFGIIGVIGSGFVHFRAYVPNNVKKVLLVVIPAQVLANIAQVVVQEEAPGVFGWSSWNSLFTLVDIVCCILIVAPVEWTLRHLREGSDRQDARAKRHIELFRTFYYWVVAYLYCTRIIFVLWDMYILYHWTWLPQFSDEVLAFFFFIVTGWKFAPPGDGYFRVYSSDVEDEGDGEGGEGGAGAGGIVRRERIELTNTSLNLNVADGDEVVAKEEEEEENEGESRV